MWTVPSGVSIISGQGDTLITAISSVSSGTINVAASNECGVSSAVIGTFNVYDLPIVTVSTEIDSLCFYNAEIQLNASPVGGVWSGQSVTGSSFNPSIGVGQYDLTYAYTDVNGCSNSEIVTITVLGCAGMEEASFQQFMSISPNPSKEEFKLMANQQLDNSEIRVIDAQGKIVYEKLAVTLADGEVYVLNLSIVQSGSYILQLTSNSQTMTERISIVK